ncbi:hypothetical protein [Nocardia sp. NPDC049149]|uniref:PPE domain-containing protein n=1 Tax=Nocardia sp. NPDC049149 TaxID=3364315 RepID=UPI0037244E81
MRQTDGRAITNPENAQSFTHAEIKQAADSMNPDGLSSAFDSWSKIASAVTDAGHQFESAIKKAVEQHWEGAAADSAVRGIRDYATRVGEFGETLDAQSTPLSLAASAASKFKASVPEVVDTSTNPRGPELRNTGEEQARDEMTTQYIQPYGATAPVIPTLPPPISPASVPAPGGDTGLDTGTVPGKSTDSGSKTGTGQPGTETGSGTTDSDTSTTGEQTEKAGTGTGEPEKKSEEVTPQSVTNGTSTTPAATTPASTTTTSPTTTSTIPASAFPTALPSTAPSPTPPTLVPAAANGSPSSTSTGAPGPSGRQDAVANAKPEPGPGTSRPAPPSTTPGSTSAQPAAAAPVRTGAPGAAGYSGMFPPGRGSQREDDDEHKSPRYLRTEEHAKELIGEVKPTVPPVLGVD